MKKKMSRKTKIFVLEILNASYNLESGENKKAIAIATAL